MKKKIKSKSPVWKKEKIDSTGTSYYLNTEYVDFYIFVDLTVVKPYVELTSWLGSNDEPIVSEEINLTPENVKDFARGLNSYKRLIMGETWAKLVDVACEINELIPKLKLLK